MGGRLRRNTHAPVPALTSIYLRPDGVVTALWASADSDKTKTPVKTAVVAAKAVASAKRRENSRMVRSLLRGESMIPKSGYRFSDKIMLNGSGAAN
jgi:hypothetical protein